VRRFHPKTLIDAYALAKNSRGISLQKKKKAVLGIFFLTFNLNASILFFVVAHC
jgi:hypothetical protein